MSRTFRNRLNRGRSWRPEPWKRQADWSVPTRCDCGWCHGRKERPEMEEIELGLSEEERHT